MNFKLFLLIPLVATLTACAGGNNQDLREYIADVKKRPKGAIEPIPTFRPYEAFSYSAVTLRSPFEPPVPEVEKVYVEASENVKPDLNREKELLEGFNMASLAMVGSLELNGALWALVDDGEGGVHPVTKGNYLGKNHGRIVSTSESGIEILEIVSNGRDGWVERPRTLKIKEKE